MHKHRPDLVVVDIEMPPHAGDDGARAARGRREDFPELAIVLLSAHVETRHSVELINADTVGVRGQSDDPATVVALGEQVHETLITEHEQGQTVVRVDRGLWSARTHSTTPAGVPPKN